MTSQIHSFHSKTLNETVSYKSLDLIKLLTRIPKTNVYHFINSHQNLGFPKQGLQVTCFVGIFSLFKLAEGTTCGKQWSLQFAAVVFSPDGCALVRPVELINE